jgi:GAF domain-containing protein
LSGTANKAPPARDRVLTTEEAALRHVVLLVARGAPTTDVFVAVAEQVARIFGERWVGVMRYDSVDSFVVLATHGEHPFAVGSRWPLDGPSTFEAVLRTGRPASVPDYTGLSGTVADSAREAGIVGGFGAPIVVDGATWGVVGVAVTSESPIPDGAETRLSVFTELVATAISNAQARDALARLVDEQAALRRVATLVARESSPVDVFMSVCEEARRVLGSEATGLLRFEPDGTAALVAQSDTPWDAPPLGTRFTLDGENVVTQVLHTRQSARVDEWRESTGAVAAMATGLGVRSAVAAPVVVEGRLWGTVIAATSLDEPLPAATESRLGQFTGLVATAIANAQARGELSRLAEEQAALRRVAVLVAQQPSPVEVFAAVTEAVGPLLGADLAAMHIFRSDDTATVIASWSEAGPTLPIGTELALDGDSAVARIFHTGAAARIDGYIDVEGETAGVARELHLRTTVGAPILVEGRLWGALMAATRGEDPLPEDVEARIAAFTELVATAIANAEAGVALRAVADEQGALRRVATLVAASAAPSEVFAAVTEEIALVLGADASMLCRVDPDGAAVVVGTWADGTPEPAPGTPIRPGGKNLVTIVLETGRPARIESYDDATGDASDFARTYGLRSAVGAPILVDGRLWGLVVAGTTRDEPLLPDAEVRVAGFTELVATAISNAQGQSDLTSLAEQQAALRRVATLVAQRVAPEALFRAVAEEAGGLLRADLAALVRFESDDTVTVMAGPPPAPHPAGERVEIDPGFVVLAVRETGRPARFETDDPTAAEMPDLVRRLGVRSVVASPIVVEGASWGAVILGSFGASFPSDTEQRLDEFTELVATAISNATARAELIASRARIVAAGDEARRRIERNLHDGTQQRLIALGLDLQRARAAIPTEQPETHSALAEAEQDLEAILADLRELSHGLHPQLLSRLGLGPSLRSLARRSPIPVQLNVDLPERPPAPLETAVYYVVSEALTNAIKHSRATEISITITSDETLRASIVDNGVGDADPRSGSGLTGLLDRVDALGGRFALESPPRGGTKISIELPVEPTIAS